MSANAIHDSFKQIAERYSIPKDQISKILESIKIKSLAKPSSEQIRGFEKVCQMVQSGMELEVAVQTIHEEAKNSNKTQKSNGEVLPTGEDQPKQTDKVRTLKLLSSKTLIYQGLIED
ncbi:hypothetical protein [Nostoc sp.]|uniref:hypothetical protein n=1 Tax=Nostoc sp. TaxID=1180 RepID=UPI002FFACF6A